MSPAFVLSPVDKVAVEGSIVVLICAANGRDLSGNAPTIAWLKDGTTIKMG